MTLSNRALWTVMAFAGLLLLMLKLPVQTGPRSNDLDALVVSEGMSAAAAPASGIETPLHPGNPAAPGSSGAEGVAAAVEMEAYPQWLREREEKKAEDERREKLIRLLLGALFSGVVLGAALMVIFRKGSTPADKNWAFGAVGAILGYWIGR